MAATLLLLIACSFIGGVQAVARDGQIWDPFDVFCGSRECYTVLGVERSANTTTISKAYRKLSRAVHPDKVRDSAAKANATAAFRLLAKANEVLQGNESRPNYDFYLDNGPRSYYKVTGKHVWKALPKIPAWFVILAALGLASWFSHVVQNQKHERAKKMLRIQISEGRTKGEGGSQLSINLGNKAKKQYESQMRESKEPAAKIKLKLLQTSSSLARMKVAEDVDFLKIVDEQIASIAEWGQHYKPQKEHLLIVRVFKIPMALYTWGIKYHRRYISKEQLSYEEREEMCLEMVGWTVWEELTEEERREAVGKEVWKSKEYDQWQEDRMNKFVGSKKYKKLVKKYGDAADYDD